MLDALSVTSTPYLLLRSTNVMEYVVGEAFE